MHQNLSPELNAMVEAGNAEGFDVATMKKGTMFEFATKNSTYTIVVVDPEKSEVAMITTSSNPEIPKKNLWILMGSGWGGSTMKMNWVGVGARVRMRCLNGGLVDEAIEAMSGHLFKIERIFNIEVHQNLLVKNGMTASRLQKITSHVQARLQCERYLQRKWPNIPFVDYEDTAKAAEDLASGKLPPTTAVIASLGAARVHKLKVLEPSIHDDKFNFTRFIAARHRRTGSGY